MKLLGFLRNQRLKSRRKHKGRERSKKILERTQEAIARDKFGRATFAALIAALKSNCDCEACEILKSVSGDLIAEFKGPGRIKVRKSD